MIDGSRFTKPKPSPFLTMLEYQQQGRLSSEVTPLQVP